MSSHAPVVWGWETTRAELDCGGHPTMAYDYRSDEDEQENARCIVRSRTI
jgi:hypothetical protein